VNKLNPTFAQRIVSELKTHPERFKPIAKGRRGPATSIEPSVPDSISFRNVRDRDLKLFFPASLLAAWGFPKKVRMILRPDENLVLLMKVDPDTRGLGVYTVSQLRPHYQGSVTTTWAGIEYKSPGVDGELPVSLVDETLIVDFSSMRRTLK
jgi:hypothetical protein